MGTPECNRVLTELKPHRHWVGRKRTLECNGAVEPREEDFRLVRIERGFLQLNKLIAAALKHDPLQPVRGDADETLAFLALAVGEIIRHAAEDVVPFQVEVPFCLEDGPSNQGVETSSHLGNPALEIERAQFDAEFLDQELTEVRLHLIVARAAGEVV
jgi:hypothetical protein